MTQSYHETPPKEQTSPQDIHQIAAPNEWTRRKRQALDVADRLDDLGKRDRASRVRDCARHLRTRSCPSGHVHRLVTANLCKDRACPICGWRRARANSARAAATVARVGGRAILLTLTLRSGPRLAPLLDLLLAAWGRISRRARWVRAFDGAIRSVEVTRSSAGWHPHLHVLLHLRDPLDYYDGSSYLSHAEVVSMWRDALRADYDPSVRLQAVRSDRALLEVVGYTTKATETESYSEEDLREWLDALAGRRLLAGTGVYQLRDALEDEDDGALLHEGDAHTEPTCPVCGSPLVRVDWRWHHGHGYQAVGAWAEEELDRLKSRRKGERSEPGVGKGAASRRDRSNPCHRGPEDGGPPAGDLCGLQSPGLDDGGR